MFRVIWNKFKQVPDIIEFKIARASRRVQFELFEIPQAQIEFIQNGMRKPNDFLLKINMNNLWEQISFFFAKKRTFLILSASVAHVHSS